MWWLVLVGCGGGAAPATAPELAAPAAVVAAPEEPAAAAPAEALPEPQLAGQVTPAPGPGVHVAVGEADRPALTGADKRWAHAPFRGALGDEADVVVGVVEDGGPPLGSVVVFKGGAELARVALRPYALWEVGAVLFLDVDADQQDELVVVAQHMTGVGPEGAQPFQDNSVIDLHAGALTHLEGVEATVRGMAKAAEVRKALRP